MKGLLLKDFYLLYGYSKQYGIILGFMAIWSVFMKSFSFLAVYALILGGMLVMSLMTIDENTHFGRYALTMPISRKIMIKEKYVMFIICMITGCTLALLIEALAVGMPWYEGEVEWAMVVIMAAFFTIAYSIYFPVVYKFGMEKARYTYILIMILMGAVILGVVNLTGDEPVMILEEVPAVLTAVCLIGILLVVDAAAIIISYHVSLKIVKNKEW